MRARSVEFGRNCLRVTLRAPGPCGKLGAVPLVQIRTPADPVSAEGPVLRDRLARTVRYLRISLTDRCNYRCTYCMPPDGIDHVRRRDLLRLEEIVALAEGFAAWGVERVRLTGGEPTVRKGLLWLVEKLSAIRTASGAPLRVAMTTNGERLAGLAPALREAGLRDLTVSLDSLDPDRFRTITRRGNVERVVAGVDAALAAGFENIKLNTVAIRGFNDDELAAISRFAWDRGLHPRFIELMPMAQGELFVPGELIGAHEVRERIAVELGLELEPDDGAGVRGHGPATYWRVGKGAFAGRRLGTIAAMTENFCADCNRLRISATGQIHACLARDESADLRAALRSSESGRVETVVRHVLANKKDGHAFELDGSGGPRKAMIMIGG
jgi:cyclic pyranopterin phosphate synthase